MGLFDDLLEEGRRCGIVGRVARLLLVLRLIWGRFEQGEGQMEGEDLRLVSFLGQTAGVQQGLVGPICELSAVHVERKDVGVYSVGMDRLESRDGMGEEGNWWCGLGVRQ